MGSPRVFCPRGSSETKAVSCGSPQSAPPLLRFGLFFGRVRVRAYLIHALDPQLAQEDVEHGHQGNGEQYAHQTEERAHDEQPEHHDSRMEGDRPSAIRRGVRALDEFALVGLETTLPLHLAVLDDEEFRRGGIPTSFLAERELRNERGLLRLAAAGAPSA